MNMNNIEYAFDQNIAKFANISAIFDALIDEQLPQIKEIVAETQKRLDNCTSESEKDILAVLLEIQNEERENIKKIATLVEDLLRSSSHNTFLGNKLLALIIKHTYETGTNEKILAHCIEVLADNLS